MVKRGPCVRPQASEGEAQHGLFAGLDVSVNETSVYIVDDTRQGRSGSEGGKRTRGAPGSADELWLPLQADWIGSRAAVAMALQRSWRSELAGDCVETRHMRAALKAQINKTDTVTMLAASRR
jgi:transposase